MRLREFRLFVGCIVLVALASVGGGRRLPPLEDQTVLYLEPPGCQDSEYIIEQDEGDGWEPVEWSIGKFAPGDGVAFALLDPRFRACCVRDDDRACTDPAEFGPPLETPLQDIWSLLRRRTYGPNRLANWNSANVVVGAWRFDHCGCWESLEVEVRSDPSGPWIASDQSPLSDGVFYQWRSTVVPTDAERWRVKCASENVWFSYDELPEDCPQ